VTPVDGLLVVDKPAGWTSHDVVAKLRGIVGQRRVGHSGTLDPDATGVLLVGLGRVTRLLRFLGDLPKEYEGEIVLGVETDTLDDSGEDTATHDMSGVGVVDLRAAAGALTGEIEQIPPMVSAVKVGGRRLHELAREGKHVERAPRPVTVHRFDVGDAIEPGVHPISVVCSAGTYVRVLAADLGRACGGGAHLRNLRRTAIGSFDLAGARGIDAIAADPAAALLPPGDALRHLPVVAVAPDVAAQVAHGARLPNGVLAVDGTGPWRVVDESGRLLAVYETHRSGTKPAVVLADPR
jgi:tRNA pseudouridine55 synthase